jgi:hypothetical protein
VTSLARLQTWYHSQCDEDWEHQFGVHIETLDNPGWSVKIDLNETPLEGKEFETVQIERSDNDWLFVTSTPTLFKIACGPHNLEEGLTMFCNWADLLDPATTRVD